MRWKNQGLKPSSKISRALWSGIWLMMLGCSLAASCSRSDAQRIRPNEQAVEPPNRSDDTQTSSEVKPHPVGLDYDVHLEQLRKAHDLRGFHAVVEAPFVVVGDEDRETVEQRSEATVRWAVDRLKEEYFTREPNHVITVWLFKDKTSYEKHCQEFFDIKPHTPFGFYSSTERALIMNISTGGGTLVHEIVHPFIAADFPACPSWFNEGLASLYEQSSTRNGKIVGLTNWRLRGLQQAIEKNNVPPFSQLLQTDRRGFYDDDPGTNYAQARYLCYYLQESGKLNEFYNDFRKNSSEDPTGEATLQSVLKIKDWSAFQVEWHQFVMGLQF